ncbi:unnamed protein product [Rotaria magnacalcarata]|nr:unnamed protein product [Rotaria magnacalcarata]
MLMHQSSSLRSIALRYGYDYSNISNYISLPPNVTSLHLYIAGSRAIVSVRSVIAVLRLCHRVRSLHIILKDNSPVDDTDIYDPITIPSINENDLPVLSQVISFGLTLFTPWNNDSIACILRCMPNLKYFFFTLGPYASQTLFPVELLDGYVWQEMLELYVPYLSKFEFHMSVWKCFPPTDLDIVIDSFENFVGKYSNWHMVIDQWRLQCESSAEFLILRTLNYHKYKSIINIFVPAIHSGYFDTRSTMEIEDDHYLFYVNELDLNIYIAFERSPIRCSSPLFQQVKCFKLELPIVPSSLLNSLLDIVNFHQISDDDAQETVAYLSNLVHLPMITRIEFGSSFNTYRWKHVQFILQACPNMVDLTILTELLISSKFIDNPSLISAFKEIEAIETTFEDVYFPSSFAPKLVERFPSLTHIELQVVSFNNCASIIDIFLSHLKNLSYLKIDYFEDTSLDDLKNVVKHFP